MRRPPPGAGRKPNGKKTQQPAEEDKFPISLKKTQPKKTPFSNRPIHRTIGTALTLPGCRSICTVSSCNCRPIRTCSGEGS